MLPCLGPGYSRGGLEMLNTETFFDFVLYFHVKVLPGPRRSDIVTEQAVLSASRRAGGTEHIDI